EFNMNQNSETTKKIYLKDYIPPHFEIESTDLFFEVFSDHVIVTQESRYSLKELKDLILNGVNLELLSVEIDDNLIDTSKLTRTDNESLTINSDLLPKDNKNFVLKMKTKMDPFNNKSLEGLYKSNNYLVTQCEAQGFRKITYFPDRPDVMTSYQVTIEADKTNYPTLLSNGDLIKKEDLSNNRHRAVWKDPWKKPCYLFALFAGDVGCIKDTYTTKSGKNVSLEIYCDHGKEKRCYHAMASLKRAMSWDENTFGREYDLSQYLIVAIDDFNAGAMENKGLNIFNSRLILADNHTATDSDFHNIESVVAHEYFHNWTGNRITLRDWFELSLKEGLTVFRDQEFSADMTEKGVQRIKDVDSLKERQFPEDAGPNAHPVRPDSCYAVDNFFTATIYEKGAEVIRMMRNFLGKKQFVQAMNRYFNTYDGQAITTDDYRKIILDDSGFDSSIFKKWYQTPGTPVISINEIYDSSKKSYKLKITQDKEVFNIPLFIDFFKQDGSKLNFTCEQIGKNSDGDKIINLSTQEIKIEIPDVNEKPVTSFLRNFSAPIKINWQRDLNDLFLLARYDDDTFNRRESFISIYLELFKFSYQIFQKMNTTVDLINFDQIITNDPNLKVMVDKFSD
ncbi:MAG: aminopeptidase N, partial [Bdellovibrionales bacterium]|nr:aminopeptidase N [Bdellovibrionales bacterium]